MIYPLTHSLMVNGHSYQPRELIAKLRPLFTPERMARLEAVVSRRCYSVAPVLENIYDRGNTSAVMRSAEAFGFANFHVIEQPENKFKAANRVTQGTDKWLDVHKYRTAEECVQNLKASGFKVFATHLEATHSIDEINFTEPVAMVFGNEKEGVSPEMLKLCDGRFIIPMQGFAQSFNISVAAAIAFYHAHFDRIRKLGKSAHLTPEEQEHLLARYLLLEDRSQAFFSSQS